MVCTVQELAVPQTCLTIPARLVGQQWGEGRSEGNLEGEEWGSGVGGGNGIGGNGICQNLSPLLRNSLSPKYKRLISPDCPSTISPPPPEAVHIVLA